MEKKQKVMVVLTALTIRDIIRRANIEQIPKEDIVALLKEHEQFVLIYYKNRD